MKRDFLRAKIHGATVTEANVDYIGSLTLDQELMDAADLHPFERIEVYNTTSGHRFATYLLAGRRGSGQVCINGAAAHLARPGDSIIMAAYCQLEESEIEAFTPRLVFVDEHNRPVTLDALTAGARRPALP
jgi:aspartate 1-decarboxylase